MKKFSITVLMVILVAVSLFTLSNWDLYGQVECRCYADNQVMQNCENYCARFMSDCTYFEFLKSSCFGDLCNQTWRIGCATGKKSFAGGAYFCDDCVNDNDEDPPDPHFFVFI